MSKLACEGVARPRFLSAMAAALIELLSNLDDVVDRIELDSLPSLLLPPSSGRSTGVAQPEPPWPP
jgi:hypothetical protein